MLWGESSPAPSADSIRRLSPGWCPRPLSLTLPPASLPYLEVHLAQVSVLTRPLSHWAGLENLLDFSKLVSLSLKCCHSSLRVAVGTRGGMRH